MTYSDVATSTVLISTPTSDVGCRIEAGMTELPMTPYVGE